MTIHTLNSNASTTSDAVAEPAPPFASTQEPRLSSKPHDDPFRCHYRYPNGRRCTLPGLPAKSGLCLRHYNRQVAAALPLTPSHNDASDLSSDLLSGLSEFSSADDLRQFLARLLILMTKGGISPRRAAVLAYITNQLLHSHRAIQKETDGQPQRIILDMPGPHRD